MAGPGSILAVDFGNVHTRAVLIDLVDGDYRMVAQGRVRTTAGAPMDDIGVGLEHVLSQITAITGRAMIDSTGLIIPERPDRSGVDTFVATASIGRPLRAALIGLVPEVSIASGLRAAAGTYVQVVETISLEDTRSEESQLNALLTQHPDLFYITGGTEDGAQTPVMRLMKLVSLAVAVMEERKRHPKVLYAGNSALVPQIQAMFPKPGTLLIAQNVRPALDEESLDSAQTQLAHAYEAVKGSSDESFEALGELSQVGVLPTSQTYNLLAEYLGKAFETNVLLVDVGSTVGLMAASVNGRVTTTIRTDIGMGHNAHSLLESLGADAVRDWLPFNLTHGQLTNYALNKTLRPGTVPATQRDLYIEHAMLRAAVRGLLNTARPTWSPDADTTVEAPMPHFTRIIGAGATIAATGNPGLSALLLLDSIQPRGIITLQSDPFGLIPALGAVAHVNPEAVVQLLDAGGLETLGTVINLEGTLRPGKPAMRMTIISPDGYRTDHVVEGGSIFIYPVTFSEDAEIEFKPLGGASVGGNKRRQRMMLRGGTVGLIIDARGRPLPLGTTARVRAEQMPAWIAQITGDVLRPIDAQLLEQAADTDAEFVPAHGQTRAQRRAQRQREKPARRRRGKQAEDGVPTPAPDTSSFDEIEFPDIDEAFEQEAEQDSLRDLRDTLR